MKIEELHPIHFNKMVIIITKDMQIINTVIKEDFGCFLTLHDISQVSLVEAVVSNADELLDEMTLFEIDVDNIHCIISNEELNNAFTISQIIKSMNAEKQSRRIKK